MFQFKFTVILLRIRPVNSSTVDMLTCTLYVNNASAPSQGILTALSDSRTVLKSRHKHVDLQKTRIKITTLDSKPTCNITISSTRMLAINVSIADLMVARSHAALTVQLHLRGFT